MDHYDKQNFAALQTDVAQLKSDMQQIKSEVQHMRQEITAMKTHLLAESLFKTHKHFENMQQYIYYVQEYATIGQNVQCWNNKPGHWQSGDVAEVLEKSIPIPYTLRVKWLSGQRIGQTSDIHCRYVNLL